MDPLQALRNTITSMGLLSETESDVFLSAWEPWQARRKQVIVRTGETGRYLYFVTSGVQRVFYEDLQGREATIVFTYAPSFGGVLDSFLLQEPSRYTYETLTASTFLRTSYRSFSKLMDDHQGIREMVNQSLTRVVGGLMERMAELQCFSAEEKFRKLVARSPHILLLVPHKYLANYIGIDPTNFSKFLNQLKDI